MHDQAVAEGPEVVDRHLGRSAAFTPHAGQAHVNQHAIGVHLHHLDHLLAGVVKISRKARAHSRTPSCPR